MATSLRCVIPAQAGIQAFDVQFWIPAFAGMTSTLFQQLAVTGCSALEWRSVRNKSMPRTHSNIFPGLRTSFGSSAFFSRFIRSSETSLTE